MVAGERGIVVVMIIVVVGMKHGRGGRRRAKYCGEYMCEVLLR